MTLNRLARAALTGGLVLTLSACGGGFAIGDSGLFGRRQSVGLPSEAQVQSRQAAEAQRAAVARLEDNGNRRSTVWDLFSNSADPNTTVEVNKYLWNASLDVLNFLPIESVDPFTGVIVTGFGTPPGGGGSYRATVYVQDPALDARSLKVSLVSRGGGAVSPETSRAVEDAILTRARQLRIRDSKL
ncbi:DUF3576 domain-containing protein [Paracoccaceae bacterium Fryx2]|nr:DUF3576 domain-containing protein [Paracoccaceae bacterium Fryx2]